MPAHSWLELPAGQGPACPSAGLPGLLGRGAGVSFREMITIPPADGFVIY